MIDYSEIAWELDLLDGMLRMRKWHGQDVIWPGQTRLLGGITVRGAFEDVRRRILFLIEDNKRLFANETEALDRMKRAEHNANLALARVRDREAEIEYLRELLHAAYLEMDTHAIDCMLDAAYDKPCTCKMPELRRRIEAALRMSTASARPADVPTNAQNIGTSADVQRSCT